MPRCGWEYSDIFKEDVDGVDVHAGRGFDFAHKRVYLQKHVGSVRSFTSVLIQAFQVL